MNTENVFLLDGLGACASAVLLGVVLPAAQAWIGMPIPVLYALAAIAVLFALNAFCAHRFANAHASLWLRVIMIANLLYCFLTASLVVLHVADLTALGVAYFAGEIVIILGLVLAERRVEFGRPGAEPPVELG